MDLVTPDWWNSVEQGWNKSGHIPGDALEQFCGSGRTIRGRQRVPQKDPKRPKTALLGHKQIWWLQTGGTVWSKGGTSQGSSPVMHSNNFAGQGGPSWGARELPKDPKRPFWAFWSSIWPPMGPPDQRKGSIALPRVCLVKVRDVYCSNIT